MQSPWNEGDGELENDGEDARGPVPVLLGAFPVDCSVHGDEEPARGLIERDLAVAEDAAQDPGLVFSVVAAHGIEDFGWVIRDWHEMSVADHGHESGEGVCYPSETEGHRDYAVARELSDGFLDYVAADNEQD